MHVNVYECISLLARRITFKIIDLIPSQYLNIFHGTVMSSDQIIGENNWEVHESMICLHISDEG